MKSTKNPAAIEDRLLTKSGISLLASTIMLIAVLCFSFTFGWFSAVNTVGASQMNIASSLDHFDLAVSGEQVTLFADDSGIISFLSEDENGGYEKLPATVGEHSSIFCNMINEIALVPGSEELSPGSFGRISFDIVPRGNCPSRMRVSFDCLPLDENGDAVQNVSSEIIDELRTLFSGHLLFFGSRSALVNGGYYYTDHLEDNSFIFDLSDHTPVTVNGEDHYNVEFYWIWPMTFSQLAYDQSNPRLHYHAVFQDGTERASMVAYVKENPDMFRRVERGVQYRRPVHRRKGAFPRRQDHGDPGGVTFSFPEKRS